MESQAWIALFHSEVFNDFRDLGEINAAKILKIIESSLILDPNNVGVSVEPVLACCRLFKTDEFHILYQLIPNNAQVYVLAIRRECGLSGYGDRKTKTHR